jgi:hypothetical protein
MKGANAVKGLTEMCSQLGGMKSQKSRWPDSGICRYVLGGLLTEEFSTLRFFRRLQRPFGDERVRERFRIAANMPNLHNGAGSR